MSAEAVILCAQPLLYPEVADLFGEEIDLRIAPDPRPEVLAAEVHDVHALFVRAGTRVDEQVLAHARRLFAVSPLGSGVDMIDVDAASAAGVAVMHNPGSAPTPVVEYVLGMIPVLRKRLVAADRAMRASWQWQQRGQYFGRDVSGGVLGVVGFGHIGAEVARRARAAYDMQVLAYDPVLSDEVFVREGVTRVDELGQLLSRSDVVTLHAPDIPATRHIIDEHALASMKPDAVLINAARGPLVDHDALVRALREGEIAAAAMDVFDPEPPRADHPLFELPNFVSTPHIAGMTEGSIMALHRAMATGLVGALRGTRPPHLANPAAWPPRAAAAEGWPLQG